MDGRIGGVKAGMTALRHPVVDAGLIRVWAVQAPSWFGWAGSLVVVGWLVYAATSSATAVSLAYAARLAPLVLVAVPAGAVVDRLGARRGLILSNLAGAAVMLAIAALAAVGAPVGALVLAAAFLGATDAVRMVTGPALTYELSVTLAPTRTIALANLTAGTGQAIGAALVGSVVAAFGPVAGAVVVAVAYASAGWIATGIRAASRPTPADASVRSVRSFGGDLRDGVTLVRRVRLVGLLIAVATGIELFGFAGNGLDPVFAGAVFGGGAGVLGAIGGARSVGRLLGSLGVAARWHGRSLVPAVGVTSLVFGLGLVAYASSPTILVALPCAVVVGVAGGVIDILEQGGLQAAVPAEARARATSLWVLTVGLGPIGVLLAGALADAFGARATQAGYGVVVGSVGIAVLAARALGRARERRPGPAPEI